MEKISDEFVAEVLAADAAEPEATFDNVDDMLDWLSSPPHQANPPPSPE